jgi:hypothetical protein
MGVGQRVTSKGVDKVRIGQGQENRDAEQGEKQAEETVDIGVEQDGNMFRQEAPESPKVITKFQLGMQGSS